MTSRARTRGLLIATALISSALGAVVVWLILTVPNDLAAGALLRSAHKDLATGNEAHARAELLRVVQEYPRTDAAAAATVALVQLADRERQKQASDLAALRRDSAANQKAISLLTVQLDQLASKPAPAPVIVQVPAPAPTPAPTKKATPHKGRHK